MNTFITRWGKEKSIPYSTLLDFADDSRFPSVMLTPAAQKGILDLFAQGCGSETRQLLILRSQRSLSLIQKTTNRDSWAEQLEFLETGAVRLYAVDSYAKDLRRIRKEYLK